MRAFRNLALLTTSILLSAIAFSQGEPQKPSFENKVYLNDGNTYMQKQMPIYLKFSTEPNGTNYDLKSKSTADYADPMYLDTEGINYIRSQWAVDKTSKKVVVPKFEIKYEIYADGLAPVTNSKFYGAPKYITGGKTYYGQGLKVDLTSRDGVSGVEKIHYSINGNAYAAYTSTLVFGDQKEYNLYYFANDNVGNAEKTRTRAFTVDVSPPVSKHEIVGISYKGNIISPSTKFKLSASDDVSGEDVTYYTFEGNELMVPRGYEISVSTLPDGNHTFTYYSIDRVKNVETKKKFEFYLDKIPPVNTVTIEGDQHRKNGRMYVSERTKVKITATDNHAGVEKITYRLDGASEQTYSTPFNIPSVGGIRSINFYATDNVKNRNRSKSVASAIGESAIYMDKRNPTTGITYGNPQFFDRDTLFINSKTKIYLKSSDYESGVKKVAYSVNGSDATYTAPFTIAAEGYQTILFQATDNVNNLEQEKESHAFVDNTPPEIFHNFSIEPIGSKKKGGKDLKVYPNYTRLYLGATDKHCGTETIRYSMNDAPYYDYSSPYTLDVSEVRRFAKNKYHKVEVKAADKLGNESTEVIEFFVGE
ncbi:MAG: Ig-like domain-containing protein [Vicingaceae bacterium]